MRRWGKIINRKQPQGQIAVFLVFIIVLVFILITITTNVSKISNMKTMVSNVTDSTALYYASQVGSWAWAMWYQLLVQMDQRDRMNQQSGGEYTYDFCYMNWSVFGTFLAIIALIILTILTWGSTSPLLAHAFGWLGTVLGYAGTTAMSAGIIAAAAITAVGLATDIVREGGQLGEYTRAINKLSPEGQILENTANYALPKLVDDPKKVLDTHDLNENGKTDDYIYRFNLLNCMRVNKMTGIDSLITDLADLIGSFCLAADNFRQYCGGTQVFPELGYDQAVSNNWIAQLRAIGYNVPDNNRCYYQGGVLTQLMADFRAERLKCEGGTGIKPFMSITNVDLRGLTPVIPGNEFIIDYLPPVNEEFPYYFPFWSHHPTTPSPDQRNPDNTDMPPPPNPAPPDNPADDPFNEFACVTLRGTDLGTNPNRFTLKDEVDQIILQLEKYRSWARGSFGYRYVAPDDPSMPSVEYLEFLYGIGRVGIYPGTWPDRIYGVSAQLTDQEIQKTFTGWYRQLYDVDNEGGEQANMTWYRQIQYFLNKTGSYANNGCGWFREFTKILRDKVFMSPLGLSDVAGTYPGLGTVVPPSGVPAYCGGKRKELKDKMDKVCQKLTALINAYNALPRCPFFNKTRYVDGLLCTSGTVAMSPRLTVNPPCANCFQVNCTAQLVNTSCVATLIQQITNVKTTIGLARDDLVNARTQCYNCCAAAKTRCDTACDNAYTSCMNTCNTTICYACSGSPPTCNCPYPPYTCGIYTYGSPAWWTCYYAYIAQVNAYYACMTPCWDYWTCQSNCAWCQNTCYNNRTTCKNLCLSNYNACTAGCDTFFNPPIDCRNQEISKLDVILYYAQKLQTLANALAYVESLIQRVETALGQINAFYAGAKPLLDYVDANKLALADRTVYLRSGGYVVNQDGATMSSVKDGLDTVFTYQWPTAVNNKPITHKVTVRLGPCKLATARAKRCRWVFGRGGELIDYASVSDGGPSTVPDLKVTIRREDQSSNLILRIFQWLFQTNVVSATATAAYSPRADDTHPGKGIRIIEAK